MSFDIIIKNGHIVNGTGNPWFNADVGIEDGKIVELGMLSTDEASRTIDASGLVVSPGFIDLHSHSDFSFLINPKADSKIRQGVTTDFGGNCGVSGGPIYKDKVEEYKEALRTQASAWFFLVDEVDWDWSTLGEYLNKIEEKGLCMNYGTFVGHTPVRISLIGLENRAPADEELDEMKSLIASAMKDGAFGFTDHLNTGPSSFAKTEEIIELCKVVAKYGGIYNTHNRGGDRVKATLESLEIGEKAHIPVHIAHHSQRDPETLKLDRDIIERFRRGGLDVTSDHFLMPFGAPGLDVAFPLWAREGGIGGILDRLRDPPTRERLKEEIPKMRGRIVSEGAWDLLLLVYAEKSKDLMGKTFEEIAEVRGKDGLDVFFDVILENDGAIRLAFMRPIGRNLEEIYQQLIIDPIYMIASDGRAMVPYGKLNKISDARGYGVNPLIIRKYVRELNLITLEDAIRRMTSFPAQRLGLKDRGFLKEGMWADIAVFDFDRVTETVTSKKPASYAEGVKYVFVNGQVVVDEGKYTGVLPGKVLRHS